MNAKEFDLIIRMLLTMLKSGQLDEVIKLLEDTISKQD